MKPIKLVFVEAEKDDHANLGEMLGKVEQTEYMFIIVPPTTKVLDSNLVLKLLYKLSV